MATSKKLTNSIRDSIVEIVINKTFADRVEAHGKKRSEIYNKVVDAVLPVDFKEVSKGREEWFSTILEAKVVDNVGCEVFTFYGGQRHVPQCIIKKYYARTDAKFSDLKEELQLEIKNFLKEYGEIKEDKSKLKQKVKEVVYSVSTFKRLKEVWPEVEHYYKLDDNLEYPVATFNPADLNNMIKVYKEGTVCDEKSA